MPTPSGIELIDRRHLQTPDEGSRGVQLAISKKCLLAPSAVVQCQLRSRRERKKKLKKGKHACQVCRLVKWTMQWQQRQVYSVHKTAAAASGECV